MNINAQIIAIGDELVSGDVVDTNSAYISKKLTSYGIKCIAHSSIGDDEGQIEDSILNALQNSDLIFVTGGLGPTDDDITVKSVSKALSRKLFFDDEVWKHIKNILVNAGREVDIYNKSQAFIPENSTYFLNDAGTAPAIIIEQNNKKIFLLPGVPSEVKFFWKSYLEQIVKSLSDRFIYVRKLKFAGIAEAKINEILGDLAKSDNPKLAFLPQSSEIIVKITTTSNNENNAILLSNQTEEKIMDKIGDYFWGYDNERIENILKNMFIDKGLTISSAESCTGGLISKLLTDISGSSEYIKLNFVTYSNTAKMKALDVKAKTLDKYKAVSKETAYEMAQGARKNANTKLGLGITGIAGPTGGTDEKPVGLVYVGISSENKTETYKLNFPPKLPREEIRMRAAKKTLHLLKEFIIKEF